MAESIANKAAVGTFWAAVDRFGAMALQFGFNLVLARLLLPRDFGAIGMIEIFIVVSQVLVDGGFASALIQKKEPTQTDYSTIFYWNILMSVCLYGIIYFCAPFIAGFYNMPELQPVLRTIGLLLITNAMSIIQTNRLRKQLALDKLALANLSAYAIAGSFAVAAAHSGYGVWSLVILQLSFSTLLAVILWIVTRWTPAPVISRDSLRELFSFGGYLLAATLLQEICKNMQALVIGKRFSATTLGLYSQASKLDKISSYTLPNILVQVMYPVYASVQDDNDRLSAMLRANTRVISFAIFPLMAILILIAAPLVVFLWGDDWVPCAPYFQVMCVGGLSICLQNVNFYAVAAKGKSHTLFNWSFYKWGFLLLTIFVGMLFGIYGILWGLVLSNFNIYFVNAFLAARHTGYTISSQMRDILPILLLAAACMGAVYLLQMLMPLHFILTACVYLILYVGLAWSFRMKVAEEIKTVIGRFINKR